MRLRGQREMLENQLHAPKLGLGGQQRREAGWLESEACGRGEEAASRSARRAEETGHEGEHVSLPGFLCEAVAGSPSRRSSRSLLRHFRSRPPHALPVRRPEPPTQTLKSSAAAGRGRGRGRRGVATRVPPASQQCACAGCSFPPPLSSPPRAGECEGRGPGTHSASTRRSLRGFGLGSLFRRFRAAVFRGPPSPELRRCVGR